MFRLVEPSSGQNTKHSIGTFSECAHCGIPCCLENYIDCQYNFVNSMGVSDTVYKIILIVTIIL
jgi:hypothetical protein